MFLLLKQARDDGYRMMQVLRAPKIPEDLRREPCAVYLRPHPDDPCPPAAVKLVLLNGEDADADYARFRSATAEVFAERDVTLPDLPPAGEDTLVRGLILFGDDWSPRLCTGVDLVTT
ncbi:hypothetical protein [Lentzea aerocolonigenes]|uniref:hypothetical protein n=1 Tax=Lentzea aerocolonigenes TaxID=68170 RepID=UPI0012DF9EF4|nr:hypothetical protein [Lentzea aerocolonigenes]MCP2245489.1 hypothetical protein [Lentzea aerocolonigenes]